MLKHITPKDVVEFILFGLAIVAMIVVAGIIESAPITLSVWIVVVLAAILWFTWIVLVARERNREARRPKLKMMWNGQWVDVDSLSPVNTPRRQVQFFDQDETNIHHLDFNKEQA